MSLNFIREDLAHARTSALTTHKQTLLCEIELLKNKFESNNLLVIQAAIGVLQERCDEIDKQINSTANLNIV